MQESRLFKIVYYLLDRGFATAQELSERFEVSVRTIYRDIDALSGAGVPVYAESGRNGGIRLMKDFVLHEAVVSEEEKQEILSALRGLERMGGGLRQDTMEKLSALFRVPAADWIEVDFSRWGGMTRDSEKFEAFKEAVVQSRCVRIFYAGSGKEMQERVICPLKISYKSRDWYLKAYCRLREDFRLFKCSRILRWELLEERFVPLDFPEGEGICPANCRKITLRFVREAAYRVYDEFDVNQIHEEENGDLTVVAEMPEDDWLIGYLLSFGECVEIMEPPELKETVAERAKKIYERCKT